MEVIVIMARPKKETIFEMEYMAGLIERIALNPAQVWEGCKRLDNYKLYCGDAMIIIDFDRAEKLFDLTECEPIKDCTEIGEDYEMD